MVEFLTNNKIAKVFFQEYPILEMKWTLSLNKIMVVKMVRITTSLSRELLLLSQEKLFFDLPRLLKKKN